MQHLFQYQVMEIYFGGDQCRNFDSFGHIALKIYLQPLQLDVMQKVWIFDEKFRNISPPKIKSAELDLRRNISPVGYVIVKLCNF